MTNRVGFHLDQQISQYRYENNADAQRTARTSRQAGQEWTDHFTYDPDTGGITASNPDTKEREPEAYAYDKIGNRLEATQGTKTTKYKANALNQYSSIFQPSSQISHAPAHDADGNQTHEGNRTYSWDGENRLIAIQEGSSLIARYTYDHQSRRIARWVNDGTEERYLYDCWNLIAVYQKGETKPVGTYTWGKDLSGSLQGAGGVGGLLFAQTQGEKPNTWIYHYDANGNITQVTDPRGNLLEQNTYDAFGNPTTESHIPNRYRFSTKPQDSESGSNYYGYRYYNPVYGRWLSRDPISEFGGINLNMFVRNESLTLVDRLGLRHVECVSTNRRFADADEWKIISMDPEVEDADATVSWVTGAEDVEWRANLKVDCFCACFNSLGGPMVGTFREKNIDARRSFEESNLIFGLTDRFEVRSTDPAGAIGDLVHRGIKVIDKLIPDVPLNFNWTDLEVAVYNSGTNPSTVDDGEWEGAHPCDQFEQ